VAVVGVHHRARWRLPVDTAGNVAHQKEEQETVNQREAARRQQLIVDTLHGLKLILTTNLIQELDPAQEEALKLLLGMGVLKMEVEL
jgi:hypothetical protein